MSELAVGFQMVTGIAVSASGTVYASDTVAGTIVKIKDEGPQVDQEGLQTTQEVLAEGFLNPVGLATHPTEEIVYTVTTSEPGEIFEIQSDGQTRRRATGLPRGATGLVRTEDGGFYVAHFGGNETFITRVEPDGRFQHFIDLPIERTIGFGYIAYHASYLYYTDMGDHAVHRIHVETHTITRVVGTGEWGIREGPLTTAQIGLPVGIALSPSGDSLYVSSYDQSRIALAHGLNTTATAVEAETLPQDIRIEPNYPNPFRDVTQLRYTLPNPTALQITVFDALGRQWESRDAGVQPEGTHVLSLTTRQWPAGLYFIHLQTSTAHVSRPMLLVR